MPGIIRVSVLEAVDLPEALTDGNTRKDVTAKVTLGPRFYKTQPGIVDGRRIDSWKSEFTFPVMNLRDKLMVTICNSEDQSATQTVIEIPSIIEQGSRDEYVELEGGGRIHLRMSFVLTDEERKKIETMRLSTLKRREEDRLKRTVVVRTVQPTFEKDLRRSPVSAVTITEVDVSTTDEWEAPKVIEHGPLGFGSTTKPLATKTMFDYARAVGSQSSRCFGRAETGLNAGGSDNSRIAVTTKNDDLIFHGQTLRESAKGRDGLPEPATEAECGIESQRARNIRVADTAAMAISNIEECMLFEGLEKRSSSGGPSHLPFWERLQKWDGFIRTWPAYNTTAFSKLESQSGQSVRFEARSGPGARWAQKSGLETSWTSLKKARRILREEWNGHVTDPLMARGKVFELIKAASFSHESYDARSLQEHQNIADSIGAVLQKVAGGAAMLLAALFMMWPLVDSPDGGDGLSGDGR